MNIIERFANLASHVIEESWRDHIFRLGNDLGYERTFLAILPSRNTPPEVEFAFAHSNFPDRWRKKYDDEKMGYIDPIVSHCATKSTPLIWSTEIFSSTRRQREMYEEACGHGIRSGVTFPIHGINGELGLLCFVSDASPDQRFREDAARNIPELSCFRDFIFETSLKFMKPAAQRGEAVKLTQRELECLKWSASGKSSWDIAQILRCSEATVNFHFANIRHKFGTSSRRQAVAKAILLGIIKQT